MLLRLQVDYQTTLDYIGQTLRGVLHVERGKIGAACRQATPRFALQIPPLQFHGYNGTPLDSLLGSSRYLEIRSHLKTG